MGVKADTDLAATGRQRSAGRLEGGQFQRLRVCFVGPMVGRNPGYVTTAGERLADSFAERGYEVSAVSSSSNRYKRFAEIAAFLSWRGKEFDAIVLMVFGGPSFIVEDVASWLAKRAAVPLVMVLRGGAMPEFMQRFPRWSRRVLGRASHIVTPSEYLARAVRPYGFCAGSIPNPIPFADYPYRHRRMLAPRLLWMRAFHPVYHPEMAIRAFALIKKRFPDATLVMAGQDKGSRLSVEDLAKRLGVAAAVRFPGFLDMRRKVEEGAAADIFLNTNRIDNQPVSVIEACALGLPVVATDVGGIRDLLADRESALLVRDGDYEGMAEAVFELLDNPDLAATLSLQGRRVAAQSAEDRVVQQWEELLAMICTGKSEGA